MAKGLLMSDNTGWIGCYQCGKYHEVDLDKPLVRMPCGHPADQAYELPCKPQGTQRRGSRYKEVPRA
jgi:hypothetical protein